MIKQNACAAIIRHWQMDDCDRVLVSQTISVKKSEKGLQLYSCYNSKL
jgi:hypothetical protein